MDISRSSKRVPDKLGLLRNYREVRYDFVFSTDRKHEAENAAGESRHGRCRHGIRSPAPPHRVLRLEKARDIVARLHASELRAHLLFLLEVEYPPPFFNDHACDSVERGMG